MPDTEKPVAQHTPGPWVLMSAGHDRPRLIATASYQPGLGPDWYIAEVVPLPDGVRDANARLMAAAPAMLRVLLEIREDLLCGGECRHIPSGVQGSILAAISHALGEPADRTHLVEAVKKHALANYETDGWDFLVECWEDKDILECIIGATTEEQAIQACLDTVNLMDERRREVQSEAF